MIRRKQIWRTPPPFERLYGHRRQDRLLIRAWHGLTHLSSFDCKLQIFRLYKKKKKSAVAVYGDRFFLGGALVFLCAVSFPFADVRI